MFSRLLFTGRHTPQKMVTNEDLTNIVETNDEWITTRTGIRTRFISEGENTSDIAALAAKNVLQKGKIDPLTVELLIVATVSGDYTTPSTACLVQGKIGAANAVAFDVAAACSGFLYGLSIADKFIKTGMYKNALIIGAEVLSKHTDWSDRSTCVIFGDGAGAVYLEAGETPGFLAEDLGSDGTLAQSLTALETLPANIFNSVDSTGNKRYISMDGRAIFQFATRQVPKSIRALLEKTNTKPEDIQYVIPHQANARILDIVARKTGIPLDKFYVNIDRYGNTSSASIPIALDEMKEKDLLHPGDLVVLAGFGGGLTWGSALLQI